LGLRNKLALAGGSSRVLTGIFSMEMPTMQEVSKRVFFLFSFFCWVLKFAVEFQVFWLPEAKKKKKKKSRGFVEF
jgi:hypothetical protein